MKFGLAFANIISFTEREGITALGRGAEAAGFESVWTVEHVIYPDGYESTYPYDPSGKMPGGEEFPIPDPLIWLSYVAAATETLLLGTGILIVFLLTVLASFALGDIKQLAGGAGGP